MIIAVRSVAELAKKILPDIQWQWINKLHVVLVPELGATALDIAATAAVDRSFTQHTVEILLSDEIEILP